MKDSDLLYLSLTLKDSILKQIKAIAELTEYVSAINQDVGKTMVPIIKDSLAAIESSDKVLKDLINNGSVSKETIKLVDKNRGIDNE